MNSNLDQQELGNRLALIRKSKGLSQDDVAKLIAMPRSSLTQLELGKRGIDVLELHELSKVLSFSIDDFLSPDFSISNEVIAVEEEVEKVEERISVPVLQLAKLKNVLLYILERCAGKPNVGETVLYKLLYFSDFNYYELYEEHLTGATYRKLPYGPVPQNLDAITSQMIKDGQLQRIKTPYGGFVQCRYLPLEKADLTQMKASEKEVIDRVIEQMGDWSANAISNYSHQDLPWQVTEDGKEISYNLAFYRESPFSVRVYSESDN